MKIEIDPRQLHNLKTLNGIFPKNDEQVVLYKIGHALAFIFKDQTAMCLAFARLEESSEHPRQLPIPFTFEQLWKYCSQEEYMKWQGFNVSLKYIIPFLEGKYDPLSAEEKLIIELLKKEDLTKCLSIIATHVNSDGLVLLHELGHWAYLYKEYQKEVNDLLAKFTNKVQGIKKVLRKSNAYHESYLLDEVHAYILGNSPLAKIQIPREFIPDQLQKAMREIFYRYYQILNS